ncbi:recombination protein NinB [Aromatoleum anaerobium]|uniref:Recombinase n=1 Tax=Aromatoleum anaerobium TaxID=182180 RepID=A0ABX1PRE9_9RHOO|nr:recombination protein NinB [Aromatoleum anaerobium]MCK0507936.1 recombination protein NinB [Aromatoleum anaerobium]
MTAVTQTLFREFVIRTPDTAKGLVAYLKQHVGPAVQRGRPLRVIVTEEETRRTNEQNRFFHGPVLDAIAEQAWWGGKQYPKEFWKEYFRRRYLLKDEYQTPDGEIVQTYWSTADLSSGRFSAFLNQVQAEAASEWGVEFQ